MTLARQPAARPLPPEGGPLAFPLANLALDKRPRPGYREGMQSTDRPKGSTMQTALDLRTINTETRVGRMLDGLLGSTNRRARVVLTVDLDGARRYHETFELRKWENRDGHVVVSIQTKGFGGVKVYHVNTVTAALIEARDERNADALLRYAAQAALRFAWTGTLPTPANGTVSVVEESVCGVCGLELTDPVSIERGIGPTCFGKATGTKTILGRLPAQVAS